MLPLLPRKAVYAVLIAFLAVLTARVEASLIWELDFSNEPEGEWRMEEGYPDFRKSGGGDLRLEVVGISRPGLSGEARALRIAGGKRGFRNVRDLEPLPARCRVRFDFCANGGAFQFLIFESAQTVASRGRGLFLFFGNDGSIRYRHGGEATAVGAFTRGIWYRAEIELEIAPGGGGRFNLVLTDLESGASVPLKGNGPWPLDAEVTTLAGFDIGLLRDDAELLLEKIGISD
ncbi:MAG TPA: hypothetical protein VNQ90_20125 [Chthoniobacteraceae bacterium]|nr:hypothetical protein [Chthoniobacteraceae bacterium]